MDRLALVLAAGEGTRMMSETPKLMHPVCGVPMVAHVLRALSEIGAESALVVGHGRKPIMDAFRGQAAFLTQNPAEGWGTGHAVLSAMPFLKDRHGQVIVTAGDKPLVLPETYARLVDEVRRGSACAMLTSVSNHPFRYSRIIRSGGRVIASARQSQLSGDQFLIKEVDASVYCFDIDALTAAIPALTRDNPEREYHLSDIIAVFHARGLQVASVPALEACECLGVNDRVELSEAERAMRHRINERHMRAGVTIIDPANTYIQADVTIAPGAVLHPGTTLENGTTVDAGAVIRNARITASHIGALARVESSVVENATVAPGQRVGPFEVLR